MKVLVTGARGLVGRAVTEHCRGNRDEVRDFDHRGLDISNEDSVRDTLTAAQPDVVINCAAWTDVDGCESDPEHAMVANARGPELLASVCRELNALLVTISTDYVFDGEKEGFYTQRDEPNPLSKYGHSKLEGERRAQAAWKRTIVVRSGYIFGPGGKNFLSTFLGLARQGKPLKAISDMAGTPTYAIDLAPRLRQLADVDEPGIYHVVNGGEGVSFKGFAEAGLEIAGLDVGLLQSVTLAELNRPAPRPRNSRLQCLLSPALGLEPLRNWRDSLKEFATTNL